MRVGMKRCVVDSTVHLALVSFGWTELARQFVAAGPKGYWVVRMFGFEKDLEPRYVRTEYTRPCITKGRVRVKAVTVRI